MPITQVRKAVIPAAGFGTRFLPASRSVPKEMLPVFDRPMIHKTVEEAANAGIEHLVIVISTGKEAIANYFDIQPELERSLKEKGKTAMLEEMKQISRMMEISYIYQKQQLGLGHAVLTARNVIGEEPFAVLLPDELFWDKIPTAKRLIQAFEKYKGSVLGIKEVPREAVSSFGIIKNTRLENGMHRVLSLVEKPSVNDAPSNLAITGPYILTPEIFDCLATVHPGAIGEIQLTDGIAMLLESQEVYAYEIPGIRLDGGNPTGLLKASIYEASRRKDVAEDLKKWLKEMGLI